MTHMQAGGVAMAAPPTPVFLNVLGLKVGGGESGPLGSSSTHVLVLVRSWEPGILKDLPFCLSLPRL